MHQDNNIPEEIREKIAKLSPKEQIDLLKQINGLLTATISASKDYVDGMKELKDEVEAKKLAREIKGDA